MHIAKLEKSQRLQRVRNLLDTGEEYSTLEIITQGRVCAVNSIISELRRNNMKIDCKKRQGVFYYRKAI